MGFWVTFKHIYHKKIQKIILEESGKKNRNILVTVIYIKKILKLKSGHKKYPRQKNPRQKAVKI